MTAAAAGPRRRARLEWALALAAAAASVALMCWVGRDMWFRLDVWDFLAGREAGSFESWVRPHAGHLQWVAVGLHRLLYGTVGLDFWPWYYLPPLVGYAGLAPAAVAGPAAAGRRPGARLRRLPGGAVPGGVGLPQFHRLRGPDRPGAAACWWPSRLDADAAPSPLVRALVALALLVMATSSSLGVAGLGACLLAVAAHRAACGAGGGPSSRAVAAYAAWYATRGGSDPPGERGLGAPAAASPATPWGCWATPPGACFGLEGGGVIAGAVVAAALAAGFGWLAWKRRLRRWDLVFGGALAAYLLMVTLVRGAAGKIPLEIARYSWPIILLAVSAGRAPPPLPRSGGRRRPGRRCCSWRAAAWWG